MSSSPILFVTTPATLLGFPFSVTAFLDSSNSSTSYWNIKLSMLFFIVESLIGFFFKFSQSVCYVSTINRMFISLRSIFHSLIMYASFDACLLVGFLFVIWREADCVLDLELFLRITHWYWALAIPYHLDDHRFQWYIGHSSAGKCWPGSCFVSQKN